MFKSGTGRGRTTMKSSKEFKNQYKQVMDKVESDEVMKQRMKARLNESRQTGKKAPKRKVIAAGLVVAAGITAFAVLNPMGTGELGNPAVEVADGVTIPKIELSSDQSAQMSMIPLVVFQGDTYTQSQMQIDPEVALALRGEKLGETTGGIHELSSDAEYTELASNIGEAEIYSVKGYDQNFRIMFYVEIDGEVYADFYENTNGITITKGEDLFGDLRLQDRITAAEWESFDSWNNGKMELNSLEADETLQAFIEGLYESAPLEAEPLIEQGIYEDEARKTLYLTLEDQTQVQLTLFPDDLVRYLNTPVFFEVESDIFQAFWDSMIE